MLSFTAVGIIVALPAAGSGGGHCRATLAARCGKVLADCAAFPCEECQLCQLNDAANLRVTPHSAPHPSRPPWPPPHHHPLDTRRPTPA